MGATLTSRAMVDRNSLVMAGLRESSVASSSQGMEEVVVLEINSSMEEDREDSSRGGEELLSPTFRRLDLRPL